MIHLIIPAVGVAIAGATLYLGLKKPKMPAAVASAAAASTTVPTASQARAQAPVQLSPTTVSPVASSVSPLIQQAIDAVASGNLRPVDNVDTAAVQSAATRAAADIVQKQNEAALQATDIVYQQPSMDRPAVSQPADYMTQNSATQGPDPTAYATTAPASAVDQAIAVVTDPGTALQGASDAITGLFNGEEVEHSD